MNNPDKKKPDWKVRVRHELIEYGYNVIYLTLVFAAFTEYRRLILATHDIAYENYWVALIEALILGKVIMISGVFHLGRGLESKALIYPTLYKTIVFLVFVAVFKVIEHGIVGMWTGVGFMAGVAGFAEQGPQEVLANSLVVFVALLPFFGIKELGRVLGREKIQTLFFHRKVDP